MEEKLLKILIISLIGFIIFNGVLISFGFFKITQAHSQESEMMTHCQKMMEDSKMMETMGETGANSTQKSSDHNLHHQDR